MEALGWDSCDIILITGDAYIDHPSFGMALIGRLLEAQGFRVGIISQPDWNSAADFRKLGKPNLFYGVTAGNMDSMINRYTADRKIRSDDAYTPNAEPDKRPDRAVTVTPSVAGKPMPGAGHRRLDRGQPAPHCPLRLLVGQGSSFRAARFEGRSADFRQMPSGPSSSCAPPGKGKKSATFAICAVPLSWCPPVGCHRTMGGHGFDRGRYAGTADQHADPYAMEEPARQSACAAAEAPASGVRPIRIVSRTERLAARKDRRAHTVIRLPSYEQVKDDPVLSTPTPREPFTQNQPGNAGRWCRRMANAMWLNPPPFPLSTEEIDSVYESPSPAGRIRATARPDRPGR